MPIVWKKTLDETKRKLLNEITLQNQKIYHLQDQLSKARSEIDNLQDKLSPKPILVNGRWHDARTGQFTRAPG